MRRRGPQRAGALVGRGPVCLLALLVFAGGVSTAASPAPAGETVPQTSSQAPRFVTARIRRSEAVLIAGESGFLDIDLSIQDPVDPTGGTLRWDRAAPHAVVWVSSLPRSGIVFDDQIPEDRPGHHILVRMPIPEADTRVLSARIKYSVSPRARAGDHVLWLEVSAPLVTADGTEVQDIGIMRSPFQIDSRLRVKLLMLLVIAATVFLFIVEWVRVDVVAILVMLLLPELGLIDAADTFRGLSSNAVVAIIGVMIISFGLNRVGVVGKATRPLLRLVGKSASRLIVAYSSLIAVISSVMQNTGAAVLFLPSIRISACRRLNIPLSRVLMPIGMAAILGGTLTMVGTSPLILLNDLLPEGMPHFGLLELTPIGLALVVSGIAYLSVAAGLGLGREPAVRHPLPAMAGADDCFIHYDGISGPFEILMPPNYRPGPEPQELAQIRRERHVNIVALAYRSGDTDTAPSPRSVIGAASGLLAFGTEQAVKDFVQDYGLVQWPTPRIFRDHVNEPTVAGTVEIVITPRSRLAGRTIGEIGFRDSFHVSALALHQGGETYYQEMADRPLGPGDAILVHGTWAQLHALREHDQSFIIISRRETEFLAPEKSKAALASFALALGLMLVSSLYFQNREYNPIPLSVCLMIGAGAMVLSRVITITEAYRAVDWRTVFLLGGLIPLGMAVSQTGTATWIARGIVGTLGDHLSPLLLLFVLAAMSCGFTLVISNVGACALLVPLGISLATQTGVDPRVAAIVVGVGVSNSFILPTHQVNALYMGPGEYKTIDYVKIGGILSLLYIVVLVTMTYLFYV